MRLARAGVLLACLAPVGASAQRADEAPPLASDVQLPGGYVLGPLEPASVIEVGGGVALTLEEVIESVDRHHPALDASQLRIAAAEGQRLAAEGAFDLNLTGRLFGSFLGYYEYGRTDLLLTQPTPFWGTTFFGGWRIGRGFARGGIPDYYRYDETFDAGELRLGLNVPLWRDGPIDSRRATLWRAEHGVTVASEDFQARRLRLVLAASEAYWRWVAAGQRYLVVRDLLRIAEERDAQIGARAAAGAIPAIEHLENRRAILERRQALVVARRALEQRALALSLYLRDEDGAPLVVSPRRVPERIPTPERIRESEDASVARAVERRPELRRFAAQRRQAQVALDLADNQLSPRLDVTVTGSADIGGPGVSDPERAYEIQQTLGRPQLDALLSVQLPFQFREARGRIDQARAELGALDAELELATDALRIEVRDARSAIAAAEEGVALATESEEVARAVALAERVRFDNGASSLLVVNLREAAAAQAAQSRVDAQAELAIARALYDAAVAAALP
ncbi:MAG: TolC family protein [Sandaracinaceae bacterium]